MEIMCLGSMDCFPVKGNDSTSYVIDGHILLDTGYSTVPNLLNAEIDPLKIDTVLFTHLHYDHYAGLSQLLYYVYLHGCKNLSDRLTVIGPPEQLDEIVRLAVDYFRTEAPEMSVLSEERVGTPKIIKLDDEGSIDIGDIHVDYISSQHSVKGRCFRLTDKDGHTAGFTGDTHNIPGLIPLFTDVDILFHEASYGAKEASPDEVNGHSSAHDCGRVAAECRVKKLVIVHTRHEREPLIECASSYYNGEVVAAYKYNLFKI